MPTKLSIPQTSLDPLFCKARTANGFTDQPVPLALLEQACTVF
ncbi:MAG: hypothetical protein WBK51_10720 [Polaromonas sp.]